MTSVSLNSTSPEHSFLRIGSKHNIESNKNIDNINEGIKKHAPALAKLMRDQGVDTADINKLSEWLANNDGAVPDDAKKAIRFMLGNPKAYSKIESNDGTPPDGIVHVHSMDEAAAGKIRLKKDFSGLGISSENRFEHLDAAKTISEFMAEQGIALMDMNSMYVTANNTELSPAIRKAAQYYLDHPGAFKRDETVGGAKDDNLLSQGDLAEVTKGFSRMASAPAAVAPTPAPAAPALATPELAYQSVKADVEAMAEAAAKAAAPTAEAQFIKEIGGPAQVIASYLNDSNNAAIVDKDSGDNPFITKDRLEILSNDPNTIPSVREAAKKLLENFDKLDVSGMQGADGRIFKYDLDNIHIKATADPAAEAAKASDADAAKATAAADAKKLRKAASDVEGYLNNNVKGDVSVNDKGEPFINRDQLTQKANDPNISPEMRESFQTVLTNFDKLDETDKKEGRLYNYDLGKVKTEDPNNPLPLDTPEETKAKEVAATKEAQEAKEIREAAGIISNYLYTSNNVAIVGKDSGDNPFITKDRLETLSNDPNTIPNVRGAAKKLLDNFGKLDGSGLQGADGRIFKYDLDNLNK